MTVISHTSPLENPEDHQIGIQEREDDISLVDRIL